MPHVCVSFSAKAEVTPGEGSLQSIFFFSKFLVVDHSETFIIAKFFRHTQFHNPIKGHKPQFRNQAFAI